MEGLQTILLKISGEAMAGEQGRGIDNEILRELSVAIKQTHELGVRIGIVVGGGNFWRGRTSTHMDRVTADHIGMLATTMNALALADALDQAGVENRVQNAVQMQQISEPFIRKRAIRHLEKGRVLIFAGGTGNPYFTTDSAAVLRGLEINADAILKATKVDGVYDKDPVEFPDAVKYDQISYAAVLVKNPGVMDATAVALCRDNKLPVIVFDIGNPTNIADIAAGKKIGTLIC
ncbi:MAG: UMP kinase [Saccharofermentanales bacterium]|jgi:uridylate kinase|nr:UMP kinase [Bacillota bacterium]